MLKRSRWVAAVVVSGVMTGTACVPAPDADPPASPATAGEEDDVTAPREGLSVLVGSWSLLTLDGEPPSDGGTTPKLVIRQDGAVAGSSGINRFMTRVVPDDLAAGRLAFAATAGTKMAGPPQAMELERAFLDRLEAVSTYAVEGDFLRLFAGDTEVLRFERATP